MTQLSKNVGLGEVWGASCEGRKVAAYTKLLRQPDFIVLTAGEGQTILDARCYIAKTYPTDWQGKGVALAFKLAKGRWIVGYALDADGMLFRGELTECATLADAKREAIDQADYLREMDQEDENRALLPECEDCGNVIDEGDVCERCGCGLGCCCECGHEDDGGELDASSLALGLTQDDQDVIELAGWVEISGGLEDEDEPMLDEIDRELLELETIGGE